MADKEKSILVVAINLCTSSFGYAYSFKEDYKRNPTEVSLNQDDLELPRFPTAMLLNPEKEFIASGDSAGRIFSNLDPYKEYYNCFYYFSEVKLSLQDTIVCIFAEKKENLCFNNSLSIIHFYFNKHDRRQ